MNLQDRKLSQGIQGEDVKLLQSELRQLGYVIADLEVAKSLFGETTRQAVVDFQKSHGLSEDGIVGANTAKELTVAIAGLPDPKNVEPKKSEPGKSEVQSQLADPTKLPPANNPTKLPPNGEPKSPKDILPSQYVIQGQIRQTDKGPAVGLTVRAFNKDASGNETKLGESVSDKDGLYKITYPEVLFQKLRGDRNGLDMVLRVIDQSHNMNQGWNVVLITKPLETLEPREVSWLPWKEAEASSFSVSGKVEWANGRPAANVIVRAFDKDMRSEEELGKAVTDNQGHYRIDYSASQFRRDEKDNADLMVRASDGAGTLPVSSEIIYNAKPLETVDLKFGNGSRPPSEYETMIKELTPLLQGVPLSELVENEEHKDISFVTGETGLDAQRIVLLVQAAKLERETESISAEVFYGLVRQKLPPNLQDLLGQVTQPLRRSLERSVLDNIIHQFSASELDEIVNKLQALRADLMLKPAANNQPPSVGDLLKTTQLTPDKQRIIAELQLEHEGVSEAFWKALNEKDKFSQQEIKDVTLTLQLAALTSSHLQLISELKRIASIVPDALKTNGEVGQKQEPLFAEVNKRELRPFAGMDVADWKELLEKPQPNGQPIGAPPTTPGANSKEKIDNYAIALNQYVEKLLPTTVIARRLEKDTGDDSPFKSTQADLKTFFGNNPSFEFGAVPIGLYLSQGREQKLLSVSDPAELTARLNGMARIFNITPRYPEMRALLADDLHSAQAIVSVGARRFTEKYEIPLGGPTKALEVYKTAEHVHATALNVYMKHSVAFNSPTPYVISGDVKGTPLTDNGGALFALKSAVEPDLSTLFGSLDLCDCEHCISLYSPAAYLADILRFLGDGPIRNGLTPLQILLARRPDIEHIELTCQNTNTQLPYVDLASEILEAAIEPRSFHISEGENVVSVLNELNSGTIPAGFKTGFVDQGYALSDSASVRIDTIARVPVRWSWIIIDGAWAFTIKRQGTNEGFEVFAWPQTSWTSEELRANPEHVHDRANSLLRSAVYPWNLPLDLPLEEMRTYLAHLGVQRHELMETFFPDQHADPIADPNIAYEYLGLTREEANIITGAPSPTLPGEAWNFWGLQNTGNDIADLTDGTAAHARGDWDVVLRRVSIFLQQSGLSYKQLLELLGTSFVNPALDGRRTIGIVSVDPHDAATCKLSQLEIQVIDSRISNQRDELIAAWGRIHRFVRFWRKLGWTMRDLDKAITALTPRRAGTPRQARGEITESLMIKLSHIQRLRAKLKVPPVNIMSWFGDLDTANYIDHLAEGQPEVASLYQQLFRNKAVIKPLDEAFTEDANLLSGRIGDHLPALVAALGIGAADLSLLTAGTANVLTGDNLNLENLNRLYRVVSLARALKLSFAQYLSIRELSGIDPFAAIPATTSTQPAIPAARSTLRFVETVDLIRASGFSINELDYLLRHNFISSSAVAPSEDTITATLDQIRSELQTIAAENTFRARVEDAGGLTIDPDGNLTRKKLALLNWDSALIEQVVATLNDSVIYETTTDELLINLELPNDTGNYEVDLVSTSNGFTFPGQLGEVVTSVPRFLFFCDSAIPVESTPGIISVPLHDQFARHAITLGPDATVTTETAGSAWTVNGQYSVVKNGGILNLFDLHDKKLRASRRLSKSEGVLLTNLAASTHDSGFIDAGAALLELQDQLQGQITYDEVTVDGELKGRLSFAGPMTIARKDRLARVPGGAAYQDAVRALYDAPRNFIARYARSFLVQDFAAALSVLPSGVEFPNTLKNKVYFDDDGEPRKLHFIGVMTNQERDLLKGLAPERENPEHRQYRDAVDNLYAQPGALTPTFLTGPEPGTDTAFLFDHSIAPAERFLFVLEKLLPYPRRTLGEFLVAQKMAETLNLEAKTARDLLLTWVNSPTHSTRKSIAEFLAPNFVESNLNVKVTATVFPDQVKTFTLLHKIGVLVTKFKIKPDQLPWLFEHGPGAGWLNFNALPTTASGSPVTRFAGWRRLVGLFRLCDTLPIDELALTKLFDGAIAILPGDFNDVKNAAKNNYLQNLSVDTRWPMDELETLLGPGNEHRRTGYFGLVFPDDYKDERMMLQLRECFMLMKQTGASAKQLSDWGKAEQTLAEELNNARSIKNTVKARYDDEQWPAVAKSLRDPLREKQRSALVSNLVTQLGVRDANELYEYFLIDFEMSPCMMTTRIKQALSSVQLFIQGFLMFLGQDVSLTPREAKEWTQWREEWSRWRKWYRVWEANRKVLLYPENWIEPELRDDKSPFFQDLENELLQSDVTMATAEDAFLHYLEKLDQVARLEIVGMYRQQGPKEILHVFGRTYAIPHRYFYRRLEDHVWSAWEKVDLDIEGDHLIPVERNRRLYLFWAIFTEKSEQPTRDQRVAEQDPNKYWEIKLAWSEYKNQSWSPKKVSKNALRQNKYPYLPDDTPVATNLFVPQEPEDFSFKTRTDLAGEELSIECYGTTVVKNLLAPPPVPTTPPTPVNTQPIGVVAPHELFIFPRGNTPQPTFVRYRLRIGDQRPIAANTTVEIRNSSGAVLESLPLNSNGIASSARSYIAPATPYLVSRDYVVESLQDEGSWWLPLNFVGYVTAIVEACFDAVATVGPPVADSFVAATVVTAVVAATGPATGIIGATLGTSPAAVSAVILPAVLPIVTIALTTVASTRVGVGLDAFRLAANRWFGRGVAINLQPIPPPPAIRLPDPVYATRAWPMQGIGVFTLDGCHGDLSAVKVDAASMVPTHLEPLGNTQIKNMMMVEESLGNFILVTNPDGRGSVFGISLPDFSLVEQPHDDSLSVGIDLREARIVLLTQTPGTFRLLAPHQDAQFTRESPFFFQDGRHTYFVSLKDSRSFAIHFHPQVCKLIKALNRDGISGLLTLENQRLTDGGAAFMTAYSPTPLYGFANYPPMENVDFERQGAYSLYNWELFFHTPFLIAMQLSKNQRFEEAQTWFHFIFDPTAKELPSNPSNPGPERFWRVKPFYDEARRGIQTLEALLEDAETLRAQVTEWQAHPFKPHVIARMRVVAYMKSVVMRYIDNLIAWGDQLFRRDTIESINEATQLYILAGQILGRRPESIPPRAKAKIQTFRTLDDLERLDSLSNAMVEIEGFLTPSAAPAAATGRPSAPPFPMRYFGIPGNDKLLGYWDTVSDRLFKIRHCLNIEGVERSLAIFEPPIDPALLVRAAAAGVDIASALNDINAAVPHYRFNAMVQKASELCNDVKALGGAFLSALEKRDAEALALLRSSHEVELLKAIREVKAQQVNEANNTLAGLMKYEDVVTTRQQYYLSRPFMNPFEIGHVDLVRSSLMPMGAQLGAEVLAAILHLIPDAKLGFVTTVGTTYGGSNVAGAIQAFGSVMGTTASMLNTMGSISATMGGYQRRQEDWTHQADLATKELKQVQKQIAAAEIRLAISEHELQNHELQIENAREVDAYMRSQKFTNQQLYNWMVSQLSGVYFQSYQLAYDVAKRAERAYRYDLGLRDSNFIQFGYWDSLKKGLLSGERLHHDLRRMEVAYLDQNKREYEITKHISLLTIDPINFVTLKETGECFVSLPEALFDIDYPGHYMRRIKSVSMTIPCVTGPYAGVNCTLTQLNSSIRHANTLTDDGQYLRRGEDTRFADSFGAIQSIVTSQGQNDGGLFETNLRDERYLPFEGAGVISKWRIELPSVLPAFDYDTISDVVLHVRYTARDAGGNLKQRVTSELMAAVNSIAESAKKNGLARLFSLRHEFPTEWHRLIRGTNGTANGDLPNFFGITKSRFPFLFAQKEITISAVDLYAVPKSGAGIHGFPDLDILLPQANTAAPMQDGASIGKLFARSLTLANVVAVDADEENAKWGFRIPRNTALNFQQAIDDILMVCHYSI